MAQTQWLFTNVQQIAVLSAMLTACTFTYVSASVAVGATGTISFYGPSVQPVPISADSSPSRFLTDSRVSKWVKFQGLAEQWRKDRGVMSSVTQMSMLAAYQKIIGMGEDVVPLIVAQLRLEGDDPDHWFWALEAITEANPIRPEEFGDLSKMALAWIRWAEEAGYAG